MIIYTHTDFYVEVHENEIPWLKLFTTQPYKELTDAPKAVRMMLYEAMERIEMQMRDYYQPEKVNIAAFGNYLPHLHIHVMARFKGDSYFPEPMWGVKQRKAALDLPPCEPFYKKVQDALAAIAD